VAVDGLLERDGVLTSLDGLLSDVAAGRSGALFVVGEAGLGKTSLIEYAGEQARARPLTVGLGRGHPMETSLPFGLLAQALDDVGGRGLLDEGGPGLSGDRGDGGDRGDRAARFYGVLRWLQDRAGTGIVLALDDLQWADADSLAVLSFVVRRAGPLGIGVLACLRPWPPAAAEAVAALAHEGHGTVQVLAPLSPAASGELLEARVGHPLQQPVAARAFALCAGNPLLLGQVAVAIGHGEELPAAAKPGQAGPGQSMLLARFADLPTAGMRCAQAASVLGTSFRPDVAVQLAMLGSAEADAALEALARTGLVRQGPGAEAHFVHPLVRQALYDELAGPVRTRLHARAFALLNARGIGARAAEHAVLAGLAGDPEAISVLERAGHSARRAGALEVAVTRFDEAVAMAGDQAGTGLLLARAEALLAAGRRQRAVDACRSLARPQDLTADRTADLTPAQRVTSLWMLGRALVMAGDHDQAAETFNAAAGLAAADDPAIAAEVLLDAALCRMRASGPGPALPVAARARELADRVGGTLAIRAAADWGQMAMLGGNPDGMRAAEAAAPWRLPPGGPDADTRPMAAAGGWGPVNMFAYCARLVERFDEADRAFAIGRAAADTSGAPVAITTLAIGHSYTLCQMGRLDEASAAIGVAQNLVELVPQLESFAAVGNAHICLHTGLLDESAQWCARVEATAVPRGEWLALLFLWDVLGHRRLREGALTEACDLYERLEKSVRSMGIGEPCLPPWPRHAIAAHLAGGRLADAQRLIDWLDQAAQTLPCRFPRIAAASGRAQLAELDGDAEGALRHYQAALTLHEQVGLPLELAETLLAYGGFLRRSGQRAQARSVLTQAREVATAAGASWLAGLAAAEFKVAGGRRRARAPGTLSAQERRVARLAAAGAANAEIGRQLYISISTVETHLEHIYAKLGIHSRYELIAMAGDPRLEPGSELGGIPDAAAAVAVPTSWQGERLLSTAPREMSAS
jgi:DNA-binding CsgD family transcriptional regulator